MRFERLRLAGVSAVGRAGGGRPAGQGGSARNGLMGGIGFALGGIEWGRASALATGAGRNGKKLNRGEDNGYRSTHAVYQNIAALLSGRLDESACLRDDLSQRVVSVISNISEVESGYQRHIP